MKISGKRIGEEGVCVGCGGDDKRPEIGRLKERGKADRERSSFMPVMCDPFSSEKESLWITRHDSLLDILLFVC